MPVRFIQSFFKKSGAARGVAPHNTAGDAALPSTWPWHNPEINETYVRSLMRSRICFLRGTAKADQPDFSGLLESLAKTQPQHQALARLWRDEVQAFAGRSSTAPALRAQG